MRKILVAAMILTAMLFADAPRGLNQKDRPVFAQGIIKIQLTETAQNSEMLKIDNSSKSYSKTGIKSLDDLNMKHSATSMKKAHIEAKNKEMQKELGLDRWYLLEIPKDKDVLSVVEDYKKDKNIEFISPEYFIYPQATPTDPLYTSQWGHNNTAQMLAWKSGDTMNHTGSAIGTVGFDTNAQDGWSGSQGYGSSTVIIGIIDSGVDTAHEDINDVAGYDFGDNDSNPMDNATGAGHGTCCAGAAAGIANNGKGVAGTAGNCKIMPLKVANSAGSMYMTAIDNALMWGADNGAHVLSMSLGIAGGQVANYPSTNTAIVYAYNAGCTLLAASGNENTAFISYPANHINVLAVGGASPGDGRKRSSSKTTELNPGVTRDVNGVTVDNEIWWGSNYGTTSADGAGAVDFIAPCIIPTTDITGSAGEQPGNYYSYFNGTSSATPYAAGFAALIKSKYPTYTPAQVASLMKSTCIDIVNVESGTGWDKYSGYGLINLQAALNTGGTPPATPTLLLPANASSTSDLTPTFDWNDVTGATSYTIQIDNNSNLGSPEYTNSPTVSTYTPAANLAVGTWYWRVLATNSYGSSSYTSGWSVILGNAPAAPTLLLPANASSTSDLTPTFDWSDVTGATSYTIQIDNTSSFASPEYTNSPTVSTYTPGTNLAVGTWYWRVLATNTFGSSTYTTGWSVILGNAPAAPTLLLPANASSNSDLTPTFDWSDVSGATSYTIQIDNNSTFASPEYTNSPTVSTYTPGTNLALGTWYWRVLSTNAFGSSAYTTGWSVILGNAPAAPTLLLPANASSTTDQTPTFDWSDVAGATSYTLLVDNDVAFGSPEITQSPTVSTYTPGTNLAYGTYYWKVLATNAFGSGVYTGSWSLIIGTVPAAPTLLLPADASSTSDLTPTFDWSDISGATSYTILVDNNSNFGSPEITQSPTVSTYTPGTNLAIGTYYWKVLTTNTFGSSSYSTAWTVILGNAPAAPTLLLPANASSTTDQTPTFDWSDVAGAVSYTLLVDNDIAFGSPEVTQSPTVSTYTPGTNLAYGTYYWKVLATNAFGSSVYTGSWSLIIGTVPAAPTLLLPADASSTSDLTPTFDWSDISGATSYTIQIDNNSNFGSPEYTNSPTLSTYTSGTNLAVGTWYWRVMTTNTFGSSSYTSGWSVILGNAPVVPTLTLPTNTSSIYDLTPSFDWNDVSGATAYTIQVDNNSDYSSPEISQSTAASTYTPGTNMAAGTYYWHVFATNAFGSSAYTAAWSFTIPAQNISFSATSINTTAAPEGSDTDSFGIQNSGAVDLTYSITKEYTAKKADIVVHSNDFSSFPGTDYTNLNFISSSGAALIEAISSVNPITGILTSPVFDGTACSALYLDFDQTFTFKNGSWCKVEYYNGTEWTQVYYENATSTNTAQHIQLPILASNMQLRITGYMTKQGNYASWRIDNIIVSGPEYVPVYTWLTINSATSGSVTPSGSNNINLTCSAAGLAAGTYNANISVASNDPDEPNKIMPVVFVVENSIPGAPINVVTSVSGTNITVSWNTVAGATSYDVYSSTDPYGTFTFETNVTATSYETAASGVKLFWYIKARN